MRIVIFGADHLIGASVLRFLIKLRVSDEIVICSETGDLPDGVVQRENIFKADIRKKEDLRSIIQEGDIIYNGQIYTETMDYSDVFSKLNLHRNGLINLIGVANEKKAKRVITYIPAFLSWLRIKEPITEDSHQHVIDEIHYTYSSALEVCQNYWKKSYYGYLPESIAGDVVLESASESTQDGESTGKSTGGPGKGGPVGGPSGKPSRGSAMKSSGGPSLGGPSSGPSGKPVEEPITKSSGGPSLGGPSSGPSGKPVEEPITKSSGEPSLGGSSSGPSGEQSGEPTTKSAGGPNLGGSSSGPSGEQSGEPTTKSAGGPNLGGATSGDSKEDKEESNESKEDAIVKSKKNDVTLATKEEGKKKEETEDNNHEAKLEGEEEKAAVSGESEDPLVREEDFETKLIAIRGGRIFGPFEEEITPLLWKGVKIQKLEIHGSGSKVMSWVHPEDIAVAMIQASNFDVEGDFMVKSFDISTKELIKKMDTFNYSTTQISFKSNLLLNIKLFFRRIFNPDAIMVDVDLGTKFALSKGYVIDETKAVKSMRWASQHPLDVTIEESFDWFNDYYIKKL